MSYRDIVQSFQSLRGQSNQCDVSAFLLLVATEDRPTSWKGPSCPYKSFRALVLGEKLCAWSLYVRFREVSRTTPRGHLELLGVVGAAQLANHPPTVRGKVVRFAKSEFHKNGRIPTPQALTQYLKPYTSLDHLPAKGETKAYLKAALRRALARICQLEEALRAERKKSR